MPRTKSSRTQPKTKRRRWKRDADESDKLGKLHHLLIYPCGWVEDGGRRGFTVGGGGDVLFCRGVSVLVDEREETERKKKEMMRRRVFSLQFCY